MLRTPQDSYSMSPGLLTVFGATGQQGSSVVKAVQEHPTLSKEYKIRGITRDPTKPGLLSGVEWVKADLDDVESVMKAVAGSEVVFGVTNFWEKMDYDLEVRQGKHIADAAKEAGVKQLIWSGVPSVLELSKGTITKAVHFESKVEVERYIEKVKGTEMTATYVFPGIFMQNFLHYIKADNDAGRVVQFPYDGPTTMLAFIDPTRDLGLYVAGILTRDRNATNGMRIQVVSEWLTPNQMIDTLTQVTGHKYTFEQVTDENFQTSLPPPIAEELAATMKFIRECHYYGVGSHRDQAKHDELLDGAKTKTWAEFVKENMRKE